ncbi:MAG: hypothetical protein RL322_165 [Pseudomonadota bacterium]|jgi:DNA ligase-associated metallophosphoesterase
MKLVLAPGPLELLGGHGVFDPQRRSLMVADLHLGKGLSFRRQGLAVPEGTSRETLVRLDQMIEQCRPSSVYILGDLLHGPLAQHPGVHEQLAHWRARHPGLAVGLVTGNHDQAAGALPSDCGIDPLGPRVRLGPWTLSHDDQAGGEDFVIAGHTHPAIRIRGRGDSLYRPCFWLRARALILPAVGAMTGGWPVQPASGERCFVAAGAAVMEIPAAAWSVPRRTRRTAARPGH